MSEQTDDAREEAAGSAADSPAKEASAEAEAAEGAGVASEEPAAPAEPAQEDQSWKYMIAFSIVISLLAVTIHTVRKQRRGARPTPTQAPAQPVPREKRLGIDYEVKDGHMLIKAVYEGGHAEEAGVQESDRLLAVDGVPIVVPEQAEGEPPPEPTAVAQPLLKRLSAIRPGEVMVLRVSREALDGTYGPPQDVTVRFRGKGFELNLARSLIKRNAEVLFELRGETEWWPHYHRADRPSRAVSALAAYALSRAAPDIGELNRANLGALLDQFVETLGEDGGVEDPAHLEQHRVYASSLLLMALHDHGTGQVAPMHSAAAAKLQRWLVEAQIQESTQPVGFDEVDRRYGGWSYRSDPSSDTLRTDVSTARFALQALARSGLSGEAETWRRAGLYLNLVQNHAQLTTPRDPPQLRTLERQARDGGFAFSPSNSKAGDRVLGGQLIVRRSYGSATADGLLGLLATRGIDRGAAKDASLPADEAVRAALDWLGTSLSLKSVPGFSRDPLNWSQGLYFYYAAALAEGLHQAGVETIEREGSAAVRWAPDLVFQLNLRFGEAGEKFQNTYGNMAEDQRTIATCFAIIALAAARDRMALGGGATLKAKPALVGPGAIELQEPDQSSFDRGREIVQQSCGACHAGSAVGSKGPSLAGIGSLYLTKLRTAGAAKARLEAFIKNPFATEALLGWGKKHGMSMAPQSLKPEALEDVVTYLLNR